MGLCTKPQENGATPPDTTLQAALAVVEKKVRNLEKRKGKLDAYRDTLQRGKSLNEDQQAAVAKYDEVIGTLEFARELSGQFTKLALDEAKDKKKMMKKEQQERAKVELIKVNYVLSVREVLSALLEEGVLEDLEGGNNGAPKLSADQLSQLQQFQELATPNREDLSKGSFDKQVAASAEHLVNLAEKKTRAVVGTTYQELAQLIDMIRESGYVEAKWANDSSANTENGADDATQDTVENEEEEDSRWGGDKGRGRGRGGGGRGFGRGNRGYSRGRGDRGGDRGHRGGDRGRNDRKYDDRREDRRDDRKYEDRGDRPRGGYRGRGENGGRGGYRGRGGAEGGRGGSRGGGQNGYRD